MERAANNQSSGVGPTLSLSLPTTFSDPFVERERKRQMENYEKSFTQIRIFLFIYFFIFLFIFSIP